MNKTDLIYRKRIYPTRRAKFRPGYLQPLPAELQALMKTWVVHSTNAKSGFSANDFERAAKEAELVDETANEICRLLVTIYGI